MHLNHLITGGATRKTAVLFLLATAALVGPAVMSMAPASAATGSRLAEPAYAIVCHDDVCIQTASKNVTYANVNAWANTTTFKGHFQLVNRTCDITEGNSPNETWPAGGAHYTFKNIYYNPIACGDFWEVIGWKESGKTYVDIGNDGFQI